MKPVRFEGVNGTLSGGPASSYGWDSDVADLQVCRSDGQIISCWRPTWLDRLRLLCGGSVWLHVMATRTHAPVCLTTESPFPKGSK